MRQIKIIPSEDIRTLNDEVNDFLTPIESVIKIEIDLERLTAIIEYEASEAWKKCMCSECQYWDDGGTSDAVMGLCQEHGGRKRFNCKACKEFKDIRG